MVSRCPALVELTVGGARPHPQQLAEGWRQLAVLAGTPAPGHRTWQPGQAVTGTAEAISTSPAEQGPVVKADGGFSRSLRWHSRSSHHARSPPQEPYGACTRVVRTVLLPRGSEVL